MTIINIPLSALVSGFVLLSVAVGGFLYKLAAEQSKIKFVVGRMADEMQIEKPENW